MIKVVGGTYDEFCLEPPHKERYGSGLRACSVLKALSPEIDLEYYTFCNETTSKFLNHFPFRCFPTFTPFAVSFRYDYPLAEPHITPRADGFDKNQFTINVEGDNILCYGLYEGNSIIKGRKIVYDPQSPVTPIPFSKTQSQADELAYVINIKEAATIAGSNEISEIKRFFFSNENASVIVIKMGAKGALVMPKNGNDVVVPVYKTNKVWPIGSGDVFAAVFAFYWFNDGDPINAAQQASWQTACYCNSKGYNFFPINSIDSILPLTIEEFSEKQVYLAGPFFTFAERWLIEQLRNSLQGMKLKVFSPLHDVGHGVAEDVVQKDLDALEKSAIVFAVLDGLDSGTLFEIGYAVKMGIPVIAYVENESSESVKMLEGTNCILEKDLTTAIYKCFWKLTENA